MASPSADFLVEIGTEELPPKALRDLEAAFAAGIRSGLTEAGLEFGELKSFATPRRLAVLVRSLATTQPEQRIEKRGPPVAVAFDSGGAPTRAAQAFADGCGVAVADLERVETPKGAWLLYRAVAPGQPAAALIPGIVNAALAALPIPRRMRWGDGDAEFVRPVQWVVLLLGEQVVPAEILGQTAGNRSRGHRFHSSGPLVIPRPDRYEALLADEGKVLADFAARRARVQEQVAAAARAAGGTAVVNDALLDEVTALVEWPVPVTGRFDERFLALPEEVLIATLQGHQRYFPVRGADGRLRPGFITLSNVESRQPELVRQGNERVILPRLTDAAFFFEQDIRTPLAARAAQLDTVVFQQGLGSLRDKSARVAALGRQLAPALGADPDAVALAAELAKADLLSSMVGEFPELQGRMGYHYARHDGEPDAVAVAIEEQYLPRHAGDRLPATPAGRALALADRLDTLAGIFALGKRPTGNKDPFGLRRAALGLLRILIEERLDLDLAGLLPGVLAAQPVKAGADPGGSKGKLKGKAGASASGSAGNSGDLARELYDFIMDRLRAYCLDGLAPGLAAGTVTAEMFEAVRVRRPGSPLDFHARLLGVRDFMALPEAESLAQANKRIANILRTGEEGTATVDPALFEMAEERALHEAVNRVTGTHRAHLAQRDYPSALRDLSALKAPVDAFFDAVLVMTDDQPRRRNRLALLQGLRALFLDVADLSCIPTP